MKKSNIVLIGMPGAGKSTVGVVLAKTAALEFVDTDLLIQKQTGRKLQDIIDGDGIDEFLKIEGGVISALDCKNSVIATGGSAVFSENAMDNLRRDGVIVYLDVPLDEIKRRVDNITTRGIAMKSGETLETVYNERLPLYKKYADITVPCKATEQTVEQIINSLYK
ncbi:MAG: shikimate kinase [Acutalibacteraceae bacterium]